jgi:hypothetical protein
MPIDKKGNCLILKFFGMKNEQEMLDLFQVEELEKRYEMGWIKKTEVTAGTSTNTQTNVTTVNAGVKVTI